MDEASVDSVVTDPPYGIAFRGKDWDQDVPGPDLWREVLRVLKPGGHALVFAGTRTMHRMGTAIEAAGFEIRDQIAWLYGNGFGFSEEVGKFIDRYEGTESQRVATGTFHTAKDRAIDASDTLATLERVKASTRAAHPTAQRFEGWRTKLRPAFEPILVARRPLGRGLGVAQNVMRYGTGALNANPGADSPVWARTDGCGLSVEANALSDGSPAVQRASSGIFYCPKPTPAEERAGLPSKNTHPTVKPEALMAYLCRLVTPPGGVVLDPFNGSGSTGKGAVTSGFRYIGIELSEEFVNISRQRIKATQPGLGI